MGQLLQTYLFYVSLAGFIILFILSILSFVNIQALKIKEGRHIHSGIILLITSIVF
jgi:hypothetical protein